MRRINREIKDTKEIISVIKKNIICRIALVDGDKPYLIPVNYGYKDNALYIHTAKEGQKLDIIEKNHNIVFEIVDMMEHVVGKTPCEGTMRFVSVIGKGKVHIISDIEEKKKGLDIISKHHGYDEYDFDDDEADTVTILKIDIEELKGKKAV